MKAKYVIAFTLLFLFGKAFGQDILPTLKKFYQSADLALYTEKIQKNISACYKAQCEFWKVADTASKSKANAVVSGKTVPMLAIQFVDMANYDLSENIYDHITLDSTRVFTLACVDGQMNVHAFANYYDGTYAYTEVAMERPGDAEKLAAVIRNINRHEPEVILFCHSLKTPRDLNSFLFIKGDRMYVYRLKEDDAVELNAYVREHYSMDEVHSLDYTAVPFVEQYYEKAGAKRRTRSTDNPIIH